MTVKNITSQLMLIFLPAYYYWCMLQKGCALFCIFSGNGSGRKAAIRGILGKEYEFKQQHKNHVVHGRRMHLYESSTTVLVGSLGWDNERHISQKQAVRQIGRKRRRRLTKI